MLWGVSCVIWITSCVHRILMSYYVNLSKTAVATRKRIFCFNWVTKEIAMYREVDIGVKTNRLKSGKKKYLLEPLQISSTARACALKRFFSLSNTCRVYQPDQSTPYWIEHRYIYSIQPISIYTYTDSIQPDELCNWMRFCIYLAVKHTCDNFDFQWPLKLTGNYKYIFYIYTFYVPDWLINIFEWNWKIRIINSIII